MLGKDGFADRKRVLEEEYFRKQEQDLIAAARRRTRRGIEREAMGRLLGLADEGLLRDLQELGFTPETVPLLDLVPLVGVAWADGGVSRDERDVVLEAAQARGISEDSKAETVLRGWLLRRPEKAFLVDGVRIVGAVLRGLGRERRDAARQELLGACEKVAKASGGAAGFLKFWSRADNTERAVLEAIGAELEGDVAPASTRAMRRNDREMTDTA
jgi:hypothetical protein